MAMQVERYLIKNKHTLIPVIYILDDKGVEVV